MFSWLWNLFKTKQEATPSKVDPDPTQTSPEASGDVTELYTARQRHIYGYFRGEYDEDGKPVLCWVDPLWLWKKLMDDGPALSADMKGAFSQLKDNSKIHTKLVERVRAIFDVKSFEDGGLTEVETIDLLNHFLVYVGNIKKNSRESPMLPEEGTSPTSDSPSDGSPPTGSSSDSTSTEKEPSSDTQEQSPSVQG